ncbi:cytochrome-c peroxidase [Chondrinema litorale]|uniref:cytochrome-c peroxidase n=1 Tax=Chondrinema litorale TaxID=2994555 RepID=UPI0025439AB2|nr:cytochrome c peroxidase [Chondrinema litorale]UZR99253.1 cytochrome C peroxidase [Chondrinema litorale]
MKKLSTLLVSFVVFGVCVYLSAFTNRETVKDETPISSILQVYYSDLSQLTSQAKELHQSAEQLEANNQETETIRKKFRASKKAFKKVEYLAEHLDGQYVKDYINGAPLPSLERNSPSLSVLEPEGLQRLEEVVYEDDLYANKATLTDLTGKFVKSTEILESYQKKYLVTDRHIFEAARMQVLRIVTLGITGFDSPVLASSLEDAAISMQSTYDAVKNYFPLMKNREERYDLQLTEVFENAINYLKENRDFDTFDRAEFIKEYANPIFSLLLDAHLAFGIETWYEAERLDIKHSLNYYAKNIFDEELINPFYFTQVIEPKFTPEVLNLGKTLFFDPALSKTNERACASCHQPSIGFTDGLPKSIATGFEGTVERNSPTLLNAVYADRFFYDLRSEVLELQLDHVITSHKEFSTNYLDLFDKLKKSDEYVVMFKKAFPEYENEPIKKSSIAFSLAAYVKSLASFNSPFDKYIRGEVADIDPAVKNGFNLFMGKAACGTCHFAPVFNGSVPPFYKEIESEVLGVPKEKEMTTYEIDPDLGRYFGVNKEKADFYKHSFKTVTVRNAAITAPYMHNGVYETLEEVVDFYNKGGGEGLGMDIPNQTLPFDSLSLSQSEQKDIVAFMQALTDTTGLTSIPKILPKFPERMGINGRKIGGEY